MNISIIQVYAPATDYDDDAVEIFYEELENTIKGIPKKDFIVIQGDWNAKIGTDAYDHWEGTTGRFGLGEPKDRGLRLLDFARSQKLTAVKTLFPHKFSCRTWHAPNRKIHNQITYSPDKDLSQASTKPKPELFLAQTLEVTTIWYCWRLDSSEDTEDRQESTH